MGNWTLVINGLGGHDNGRVDDIDVMAAEFIGRLRTVGQRVDSHILTVGGSRQFADDQPLSEGN